MHSVSKILREWEKVSEQWRDEQARQFEQRFLQKMLESTSKVDEAYRNFLEVSGRR
jgi:protein associated with RNAse G/E